MIKKPHDAIVAQLVKARNESCFPPQTRRLARNISRTALGLLFPHFAERQNCDEGEIKKEIQSLSDQILQFQNSIKKIYPQPDEQLADKLIEELPHIHKLLELDASAILNGDPAAKSIDEVILTYPGFLAISTYRLAHELGDSPLLPRLMCEWAHSETGVDIHPGATIGRNFFIDHGTGTVIGETCKIGNGVKLYQGVTLGAASVEKSLAGAKRHPTIEDNVLIYANATILGGNTIIGHDSIIGGNAWVTSSVPPYSVVNRQSEVQRRTDSCEENIEWHI